jgi:tetratricopeptide (TPR) repeat protein
MSGRPVLFLSHASIDVQTAHELKRRLLASPDARAAGLEVFLDRDDLTPGRGWQEQLEHVITDRSTAFAVLIGTKGVVNWVDREVRTALSRATKDRHYPFVPVFIDANAMSSSMQDASSSGLPPFARQFHGVCDPLHDEKELAKLLRAALGGAADENGAGRPRSVKLTGAPFVGLRAMTEGDADLFFGREDELDALVAMVRANRLVAIVADSGSGKSSLAQAGLIPRIRGGKLEDTSRERPDGRAWQVVVMRPGSDPVEGLRMGVTAAAERLGLDGAARAALRQRIDSSRTDPSGRAEWAFVLQCELPAKTTETVLIVDQFEELLTQTPTDKRQPFIDWLMEITSDAAPIPVRAVLTIRADYFNLCSAHAAFYERIKPDGHVYGTRGAPPARRSAHFRLKALTAGAGNGAAERLARSHPYTGLAAIVHRPLILAGRNDEAQRSALLAAIRHDVSDRPGDLALVQMALYETWRESKGGQENLVEAYGRIGGVAGALAHAAEEVRTVKLSEDEAGLLEAVLVRLVNLGETGGATRRAARWKELDSARRQLAEKLTKEHCGRLLLAGSDTVEICHEQLITQWPWWQNALSAAASDERRLARLMLRAAEWSSRGRPKGHLATGAELDFFRQIARRRPSWLSASEVAFVTAATWWARFWRGVGVAVFLVAAGVGLWAYNSQRKAQQALATIVQIGDTLVVDLGQEFQKRNLPADLLNRMLRGAIEGYNRAIESDPKNVDAYRGRGLAYLAASDFDGAMRDFDQMIQLDPGSIRGYGNRGLTYLNKGDYDRAIRDLDQVIRLDPKNARGYINRGRSYAGKRDYDRAIQDYDQAIELDSKFSIEYTYRGSAYKEKGDYDRAIQDFDQAILIEPNYAYGYGNRGAAYENKGDYDRAIQDYDQAILIDPKYANAYNGRGDAYVDKGDYGRAIQDYDQAIKLDPKYANAYNGRGLAYANKGDYDLALRDYDQAIQIDPKDSFAYKSRSVSYFSLGNFSKAAEAALRAGELKDDAYAMIWRYLARQRAGENGAAELEMSMSRLKNNAWPYPVIELYLGRRKEIHPSAGKPDEVCEAQFYGGEWHLLHGDRHAAAAALEEAAVICPKTFIEYAGLLVELKRLGSSTGGR